LWIVVSCGTTLPKLKEGEFFIQSSLGNKVVAGETIEVFYHVRKGEKVDYFFASWKDDYDNYSEKYFEPVINDSLCSFKIMIPHNACSFYALPAGNIGCFTGGYSRGNFIVYSPDGTGQKGSNRQIMDLLLERGDTIAADSLIKISLQNTPNNLMVLDNYWLWLYNNGRTSQLQDEINKIKNTLTGKDDENLALICKGYYYLGQADSMTNYLEKYIQRSPFPGFANDLISYLSYLNAKNNLSFEKEAVFQARIAEKCPMSGCADRYLEQAVSIGKKDVLAEKIIALKVKQTDEDFYFKALYDLQVLKDTAGARKSALKYLDYAKDAFIPSIEWADSKDVIRIPAMYELLADISQNPKESYDYISKAIDKNINTYLAGPLHAKAAKFAFTCGNTKATDNHIIRICSLGKLGLAKATIAQLYPKDEAEKLLSSYFEKAAALCETVPDLTFTIDSATNYSTHDQKIIYLQLWNPGCIPCIKEIPLLNKLRNAFASTDIIWLAQDFGKYMDKLPAKFDGWSLYQANEAVNKAFYKQSANPQTYIIDRHKRIRCHVIGYFDDSMEDYKLILELLMREK
jgi:thiol-disulfide isomerase/thioredoxin